MPLYDFQCRNCGHRFDDLVRQASDAVCPECDSRKVERLISSFAVKTAASAARPCEMPPGACGSCGDPGGPGACQMG